MTSSATVNANPAQAAPKPSVKGFGIVDTFSFTTNLSNDPIDKNLQIRGYDFHPEAPDIDPNYVFNKENWFHLLYFFLDSKGTSLCLTGPQGSGKTSSPSQFLARLNRPVTEVTAHEKMMIDDLLVRFVPDGQGGLKPIDGLLTRAIRFGHAFILNEPDSLAPGELLGLNGIRDKGHLVVPQTGQVVKRHPDFRLIYTMNSKGSGDQTGLFAGVKVQNVSSLDGVRTIIVDYPAPEIETDILERVAPKLGKAMEAAGLPNLLSQMVAFAGKIRAAAAGERGDLSVSVPMSTRTLVNWANLVVQYHKSPTPLKTALCLAYTNRLDETEAEAVHSTAEAVFGQNWQ